MRQESLFNRYNALIMSIEGMKSPDILKSGVFRKSRQQEIKRYTEDKTRVDEQGNEKAATAMYQRNSHKVRDLVRPARRIVLSVCDGYFMMSPKWDQYFTRKRKKI